MDATDLRLILGRVGLSARRLHATLAALRIRTGSINAIGELLGLPSAALAQLGLPSAARAWLGAPDMRRLAADRRWQERQRIMLIDTFDTAYPPRLADIPDAPALLYVRGDPSVLRRPQLAIVGTRQPTLPGRDIALRWAAALSRAGWVVTSGLALGIDAAAHRGALSAAGATVAVLGTGLDRIYPRRHESLAQQIIQRGALVSELPPGSAPVRWSFPRRNRLISGLSVGTLVVEAASDSGSLTTARRTLEQGRLLFAIPGSIHNDLARGCHRLIRSGARLVESTDDMLQDIAPFITKSTDSAADMTPRAEDPGQRWLDKGHKILLDALGFEPASIDTLVGRTGFPSQSGASMLQLLELQGIVGAEPGGRFVRLFDVRHG